MSLRSPLYSQHKPLLAVVALLVTGFLAIALLGYYAAHASVRDTLLKTLYLNLLIGALVTLTVLVILYRLIDRYQQRIDAQATLDSLTELPNRRGFDLLAVQALHEAQREPKPLAALLLELDEFKRLGATHGHIASDQLLTGFARDLTDSLRHSDIVCRWSGEAFIVLLKDTDGQNGLKIAEKIRQRIAQQRYFCSGKELRVTVSIGVTTLQDEDTLHSLLSRTDHALQRARQTGNNRTCVQMPHSSYE
ncbi:GGDEF domain-containing protein [Pseudomonas fluorescens]|uniref:diguanylate cyclase n=1 Tax=Pseudomonas fluorescens TaxID=294 RepID=A0A944DPJ2_PSEFL|nr:GGDEF domain-containing protein [Pseudomonas fluorescens]MBT2307251.1 GGDEF domain-containing protein [Pseudomonas fluorescens]MBT2315930.1 GGDEF domain-containing protein [Pseudomonas fluorescens]MBT2331868.1 GGDEF domain-containing protein [Pseudomonas fluorescens]MBT2345702.1 GGDEF domain-containing protein [Pseudomonas fluorescens]